MTESSETLSQKDRETTEALRVGIYTRKGDTYNCLYPFNPAYPNESIPEAEPTITHSVRAFRSSEKDDSGVKHPVIKFIITPSTRYSARATVSAGTADKEKAQAVLVSELAKLDDKRFKSGVIAKFEGEDIFSKNETDARNQIQ